jgi:hypothetical protein
MVFGMAEQYRNPVSVGSRYLTPDESNRLIGVARASSMTVS